MMLYYHSCDKFIKICYTPTINIILSFLIIAHHSKTNCLTMSIFKLLISQTNSQLTSAEPFSIILITNPLMFHVKLFYIYSYQRQSLFSPKFQIYHHESIDENNESTCKSFSILSEICRLLCLNKFQLKFRNLVLQNVLGYTRKFAPHIRYQIILTSNDDDRSFSNQATF